MVCSLISEWRRWVAIQRESIQAMRRAEAGYVSETTLSLNRTRTRIQNRTRGDSGSSRRTASTNGSRKSADPALRIRINDRLQAVAVQAVHVREQQADRSRRE